MTISSMNSKETSTATYIRRENDVEDISIGLTDDGLGPSWKFWRRRRYIVAILAFFGFFSAYALRVNLSVAIVAMTTFRNETLENGTIISTRDFDWNSEEHGLVLSSFFYGYLITQIPGGYLADKFGGSRVYGIGLGVTALLTLLTPPLARSSVYLLLAARVVEGLFEGVTYPCMHAVWAKWAPPFERSFLVSWASSGAHVGTVISLPLSAILAQELGWDSVFYVFGTLVLIWFIFWWIFVAPSPADDPRIDPRELMYIQRSQENSQSHKHVSHPWGKFLTSSAVWAIVVANFAENWGFYTLLTQLPTFMEDVLDFKLEKTGFMSAVPYLVMFIAMQFTGRMADWLRVSGMLTTTQVRKLFTSGAYVCQAIFTIIAAYLLTPVATIICLSVAVGLGGFAYAGFFVNHLDIAPRHAGMLMGFSNSFGTLSGILSPLVSGFVVQSKDASEWKIVFYIGSAIYVLGAIVYAIFASGEIQSWAKDNQDESINTNEKTVTSLSQPKQNQVLPLSSLSPQLSSTSSQSSPP